MLILDEPYMSVAFEADIQTLVLVWRAEANHEQLRAGVTRALEAFQAHNAKRWITDARVQWQTSDEDTQWIYRDVFGALVKAGLKFFGLVRTESDLFHGAEYFKNLSEQAAGVGVELRTFADLEQTRSWIQATDLGESKMTDQANTVLPGLGQAGTVQSKTVGKVTELTLINPIKAGQAPALRQVLSTLPTDVVRAMTTIHFARWVLIDNDTRLLFTSNFDGTWEAYLRDFVEKMPEGLDAIWGHCEEYPGARPYEPFAAWVRKYQIETTLFYAAYPAASTRDVLKALDWKAKTDEFQKQLAMLPNGDVGQVKK